MLYWLMNLDFAGGDGSAPSTTDYAHKAINRPKRGNIVTHVITQMVGMILG